MRVTKANSIFQEKDEKSEEVRGVEGGGGEEGRREELLRVARSTDITRSPLRSRLP
jgi:hypothetical protein